MSKETIKKFEEIKFHFNRMVEAYEELPMLASNVQRVVLEDAMTAIAAVFEGINQQILDVIEIIDIEVNEE
tara:strand:+ start:11427 stop:11639 length:213 start_codon:yes stop_codon:yes gene_type:complete